MTYKKVAFCVLQAHCSERNFIYTGTPGSFNVTCRMPNKEGTCSDRCNESVCPIWNSERVEDIDTVPLSLREVNVKLNSRKRIVRRSI